MLAETHTPPPQSLVQVQFPVRGLHPHDEGTQRARVSHTIPPGHPVLRHPAGFGPQRPWPGAGSGARTMFDAGETVTRTTTRAGAGGGVIAGAARALARVRRQRMKRGPPIRPLTDTDDTRPFGATANVTVAVSLRVRGVGSSARHAATGPSDCSSARRTDTADGVARASTETATRSREVSTAGPGVGGTGGGGGGVGCTTGPGSSYGGRGGAPYACAGICSIVNRGCVGCASADVPYASAPASVAPTSRAAREVSPRALLQKGQALSVARTWRLQP